MQVSIKLIVVLLEIALFRVIHATNKTSSKKGLSVWEGGFYCGDIEAFSNLNWYYNWGWEFAPQCGPQPKPGNYVPMIWGYYGDIGEIPADPYDTILGFNEPNHQEQANLSPQDAAIGWIKLQEKYPDKILISPSAAPGGSSSVEEWFDEFFEICEELGCRVDYLATHSYTGNAKYDVDSCNNLYQRYGRKVWLTEFAKPTTRDPEVVLEYMKEILPMLEEAESVWKYSWFVSRYSSDFLNHTNAGEWYLDKANSLLDVYADFPLLTPLGKFYDEF